MRQIDINKAFLDGDLQETICNMHWVLHLQTQNKCANSTRLYMDPNKPHGHGFIS